MPEHIIYNARIWACAERPEEEWMTYDSDTGYVIDVGRGVTPVDAYPASCRHDMGGRRVLPGFHESHIHVSALGDQLCALDLNGCQTIQEVRTKIADYCKNKDPGKWVVGFGFDDVNLDRTLYRDDLDDVTTIHPVFINHTNLHSCVLNTKALQHVGMDENTPCPSGGVIEKYSEGHARAGQLNGVLKDNAMTAAGMKVETKQEDRLQNAEEGLKYCLKQGVTSVHSNEGEPTSWRDYCHLADTGKLPIRVFYTPYFRNRHFGNFPEHAGVQYSKLLSCDRVKLFTDGALGCCTAALTKQYVGADTKGVLIYSQNNFNQEVAEATSRGFRLEMHVIGDAGADLALRALEYADVAPEKRPILTHCQILREDQLRWMKTRGAIANIQPQFVVTDTRWLTKLVPEELTTFAYVWKTLKDTGIVCAGGSDAPVEEPKPLLGMYDVIFRQMQKRQVGSDLVHKPEERYSITEALELYTKCGAYTTFREKDLGQLRRGFQADFIVLDSPKDIVDHPESLLETEVVMAFVAGHLKYEK